jgi:hypothetical protein
MARAIVIEMRCSKLAIVWAITLASCLSPTLPLPPPDAPQTISVGIEPGTWRVQGQCTAGAVVLVKVNGLIAGIEDTNHDGRYSLTIKAEACDEAEVWELFVDTTSKSTGFIVQPTQAGAATDDSCK